MYGSDSVVQVSKNDWQVHKTSHTRYEISQHANMQSNEAEQYKVTTILKEMHMIWKVKQREELTKFKESHNKTTEL